MTAQKEEEKKTKRKFGGEKKLKLRSKEKSVRAGKRGGWRGWEEEGGHTIGTQDVAMEKRA